MFFHLSLQVLRNDDAPKHDRIVGFKASAVKVLLELPEPARNWILHTVSMYAQGIKFNIFLKLENQKDVNLKAGVFLWHTNNH